MSPSTRPRLRLVALAVCAVAALGGGIALAQQPPTGAPPGGGQIQPRPIPGHPPLPGAPGGARGLPPGGRPGMIGPDGRPVRPPPGSRRPQLPPGFNPRGNPPAHAHEEEEHVVHHECPGHGAEDPPPPVNLWHGLLMVDNERAQKGDFVNRLLFRYENPKDPCDAKNEPAPFLASLLNFSVLAFVLFRFGRKPMAEALIKRKQTIMADIDTATKLEEEAQARLEEYQEKLDNISAKKEELRAELAAQAEAEKKHVLAEAEERRVRMRRDAEFRVEQEGKEAKAELLREAVIKATIAAEELVAKQATAKDLERMADDYLKSIGSAIAAGASSARIGGAS